MPSIRHAGHTGEPARIPEEIADRYPSVPLADVYATIAYCLRHPEEAGAYLREADEQEAQMAQEIQARFPAGLRKRWLAQRGPVAK